MKNLWCVDSPYFSAAIIEEDGIIIRAAPILDWVRYKGKTIEQFQEYCKAKGWEIVLYGPI